jgi:hypothetical protein
MESLGVSEWELEEPWCKLNTEKHLEPKKTPMA